MTSINIGKNITLDVDVERITAHKNVVEGLVMFALKQRLTNAHASITATEVPDEDERREQSEAAALKLLDSMYAGNYAIVERGARADAVGVEIRRLAEAEIKAAMAKAGIKIAGLEKGVFAKTVAKHAEKHDARLRPAAEEMVRIAKAAKDEPEIDLGELGIEI